MGSRLCPYPNVIDALALLLRIAGAGLIALSVAHIPIGKHLKWSEDAARLSPVNASIFRVHTLFICLVLVMMGLPCLLDPMFFLEKSRAAAWLSWSFAVFWMTRLYVQWFVYQADLWRGKRMETFVHWWFTFIWSALALLFTMCGVIQSGWFPNVFR